MSVDGLAPIRIAGAISLGIKRIKTFLSVANQKSISKAAKALGVSQQAVSNSMKALESEIGFSLLYRTNKGIELTEQGKLYWAYATEVWLSHQKMEEELRALSFKGSSMRSQRHFSRRFLWILKEGTLKSTSGAFR